MPSLARLSPDASPRRNGTLGLAALRPPSAAAEPMLPPLRHPGLHLGFVAVATLDILLTWRILGLGGVEVNPIARAVIDTWALHGMMAYKYALTVFVIVIAEVVARARPRSGHWLPIASIVISAVPVVWSTWLLTSLGLGL